MSGSLFDIVGPVMVGPSSSHTAGAVRLGNLARFITGDKEIAFVEFVLYNSFAKTYRGHGTDRGLLAGILGHTVNDDCIRDALEIAAEKGLKFQFTPFHDANNYSPNTVVFKIQTMDGETITIAGHSVGGGKVYISKINDYNVSLKGEFPTLLLYYKDQPGMIWQVTKVLAEHNINIATLNCNRRFPGQEAFMTICLDTMPAPQDITEIAKINDIYMMRCINRLPA